MGTYNLHFDDLLGFLSGLRKKELLELANNNCLCDSKQRYYDEYQLFKMSKKKLIIKLRRFFVLNKSTKNYKEYSLYFYDLLGFLSGLRQKELLELAINNGLINSKGITYEEYQLFKMSKKNLIIKLNDFIIDNRI